MLCFGPEDCFFVVGNAGGILAAKTIGFDISPGGPCSGDSGGPVLVDRSGTEYVAGINSYVGQNCDSYAASTLTDGHWSFIQNFIGNGPFEVCEGGYDEDGDGMVDCNDSDCSQDTTCIDAPWTTADVVCNPDTHPCPDGSACIVLTSQPNWPEGAGICAPTCSQPGATNGECLEETSGLGLCGLSGGFGSNCVLYCGSAFGESCPSGFTCRDFDNGAANPQQGLCVPDRPPSEPNCADGLDEDQDGLTDCDDPDCADDPDCSTSESCTNGVDDDGDGDVDCDDSDCQSASVCNQNEVCDNGSDDDGDGLIDCDDSDCDSASVCDNVEICTNGTDDDGDGDVDCADSDCSSAQVCNGNEDCFNEVDDDGDGLVDCQDPECATAQHCSAVEICDNGSDDDGDGRIDCADADCNGLSGCQPAGEEDSGCSCRAASAGTLPGPGWVLIFAGLLGAMLFGRRKRRLHR
jgi:MYXO-CTERM domain-containing protein